VNNVGYVLTSATLVNQY